MDNSFYRFLGIKFKLSHEPFSQKVFLHTVFWLIFLGLHLSYFIPVLHKELLSGPLKVSYALYYLRLIPIFYCYQAIFYFLQSRVRPFYLYLISLIAALVLMHLITTCTYFFLDHCYGLYNLSPAFVSIGSLYLKPVDLSLGSDWLVFIHDVQEMQLLFLPLGLKLAKYGSRQNALKRIAENYALYTELKNLREQLAPHLVYNLINAAYNEIYSVSEKSAFYLAKLTDILRYSLYQAGSESILLEDELYCIRSYIQLEEARRGICPKVSFVQQGSAQPSQKIPTMILLTLTENAFKHSVGSPPENNWVHVFLKISSAGVLFQISNSKPPVSTAVRQEKHSGIGLQSIKKLLDSNFAGRHTFKIKEIPQQFEIEVSLPFVP